MNPQPGPAAPAEETGFLVEDGKRLSESVLFRLQRKFYDERGPGAWNTGIVPSYATSNPYIAQCYAHVIMGFLRDLSAAAADGQGARRLDRTQPVYVVELSAGSGRFAFLTLKKLLALKNASSLRGLDVRYVMTDFTMTNLKAWAAHPQLKPFIEQGVLHLGLFDVTTDREIKLVDKGESLSAGTVTNPLVVLANYAFDVWPQDLFRIEGGKLNEVKVAIRHETPDEPDLSQPDVMLKLSPRFTNVPVEGSAYGDPAIDPILARYAARLADTTIAIPIAAFRGLRTLFDISGRRILVLTSDKGYTHEDELSSIDQQSFQLHGASFSMMVNYHAVGQFFEGQGGLYTATSQRPMSLKTAAFLLGGDVERYAETLLAFREHVDTFGPCDYYTFLDAEKRATPTMSLEQFLLLLRLSRWDPNVVLELSKDAIVQTHAAPDQVKLELRLALDRVWENFYPMGRDLAFELARFCLALKRPQEAIRYNETSIATFGADPVNYLNLGIAHSYAENPAEAMCCFDRSLEISPGYGLPKAWRLRVLAEMERGGAPAADQRQNRYETPLASPSTASSMKL